MPCLPYCFDVRLEPDLDPLRGSEFIRTAFPWVTIHSADVRLKPDLVRLLWACFVHAWFPGKPTGPSSSLVLTLRVERLPAPFDEHVECLELWSPCDKGAPSIVAGSGNLEADLTSFTARCNPMTAIVTETLLAFDVGARTLDAELQYRHFQ